MTLRELGAANAPSLKSWSAVLTDGQLSYVPPLPVDAALSPLGKSPSRELRNALKGGRPSWRTTGPRGRGGALRRTIGEPPMKLGLASSRCGRFDYPRVGNFAIPMSVDLLTPSQIIRTRKRMTKVGEAL